MMHLMFRKIIFKIKKEKEFLLWLSGNEPD